MEDFKSPNGLEGASGMERARVACGAGERIWNAAPGRRPGRVGSKRLTLPHAPVNWHPGFKRQHNPEMRHAQSLGAQRYKAREGANKLTPQRGQVLRAPRRGFELQADALATQTPASNTGQTNGELMQKAINPDAIPHGFNPLHWAVQYCRKSGFLIGAKEMYGAIVAGDLVAVKTIYPLRGYNKERIFVLNKSLVAWIAKGLHMAALGIAPMKKKGAP